MRAVPAGNPAGRFWRHVAQAREKRAAIFLAALSLLFFALSLVVHSPALLRVDIGITRALQQQRNDTLTAIATGVTHLGDAVTLGVLGTGVVFAFLLAKRRWAALLCVATLTGHPLNLLLKQFYDRPRPDAPIVSVLLPAVGLSFPSGHAMASAMFYGFVALMVWIHVREQRPRFWGTLVPLVLVVGIGLSRIYVGAHWFSDVIGGWTAGLFFLFALAELYKAVESKELARRS